ncbi:MAG TPA: response regulator [Alphaproteobacteria bacterium]|nr:response regulator [Alphaproteobacteria bacterium]
MADYSKTTVMVIEDDPHYMRQMLRILKEQGFAEKNITTAMSFDEARTKAEAMKAPDLIVTDYLMPGGDGIMVLEALNHLWPQKPQGHLFHPAIMVTSDPDGFLTRKLQRGSLTGADALEHGVLLKVVPKAENAGEEGVIKAEIRTVLQNLDKPLPAKKRAARKR